MAFGYIDFPPSAAKVENLPFYTTGYDYNAAGGYTILFPHGMDTVQTAYYEFMAPANLSSVHSLDVMWSAPNNSDLSGFGYNWIFYCKSSNLAAGETWYNNTWNTTDSQTIALSSDTTKIITTTISAATWSNSLGFSANERVTFDFSRDAQNASDTLATAGYSIIIWNIRLKYIFSY